MVGKKGWHATRLKEFTDTHIRPYRMDSVYLFTEREDAELYKDEFGYENVLEASYKPSDVLRTWKPKYAPKGKVVRLKPGRTARLRKKEK